MKVKTASTDDLWRSGTGVAIAAQDGSVRSFGGWTIGVAWSTIKVPLAVAALRRGLDVDAAMITESDNAAAERLWSQLGEPMSAARQVQAVLRDFGDERTEVEARRLRADYTPFGQTQWALADQARFVAGMAGASSVSPVVELMNDLVTGHRWGLAAKGSAAKGGWGPGLGEDYLVRQLAIVAVGSTTVGVALAAEVPTGGYEAGVDVVDELADWVLRRLAEQ